MYKVLLVDDERLELNTLRNYVDWGRLGITTVYTANNGLQALELALSHRPDLVFTDIRMPVMDGIEFAEKLRQADPRVKILFLTGYDDMNFIRQAFRLSASDYILKPFLVEDIEQVVASTLARLEQEQRAEHSRVHAESKLLDHIFKDDAQPLETLIPSLCSMENTAEEEFRFGVVGLYGREGNPPDKLFFREFPENFYYVECKALNLLLIRTSVEVRAVAERMAAWLQREGYALGVVWLEGIHRLSEARQIRKRFEQAAEAVFYLEAGTAASLSGLLKEIRKDELTGEEQKELHSLRSQIVSALAHGDSDRCMESYLAYLGICASSSPRIFRNGLTRLYSCINDELVIENEELSGRQEAMRVQGRNIGQLAQEANNSGSIREGMEQYLRAILSWYGSLRENANYRVVLYVEDYIEKHYMEMVSIEDMASEIGLSPNYVRSIFKNNNGMTINAWLAEYRLEKACRLLKNTAYKVSQVAEMVGYDNTSYFCSVFQKRYGKTPNEWRRGL